MNSICFFSSYFNKSSLPYYIKFYLDNLIPYFTKIIYITNTKVLSEDSIKYLNERNIQFLLTDNEGLDFGMWYKALKIYDINTYDRVGLINDSCILFKRPDDFFNWLEKKDYDYCGMVDSNAISYHIQSYFLIVNKKAIHEVYNYFMQHEIVKDVIKIYEIGMCSYLLQKGLKLGACYSTNDYSGEYSPMYYLSEKLIEQGLPLIKKKIILCSYRTNEYLNLMRMKFCINPKHYIKFIKHLYHNDNLQLINFDIVRNDISFGGLFLKLVSFKITFFFFRIIRKFKI
jgi:lipopolysaccharide biosynthesis protein